MVLEKGKPIDVYFGKDFVSTDEDVKQISLVSKPETNYCLVELPAEELVDLEAGALFTMKQHSVGVEGNAALCTKDKTYSIEFLENSNSLFLGSVSRGAADAAAPAGDEVAKPSVATAQCSVFGQTRGQIILKHISGDLKALKELLAPHELPAPAARQQASGGPVLGQRGSSGPGNEPPPVTTELLERRVAASPTEIRAFLREGPYVEVSGHWKVVPSSLCRQIVHTALSVVTAKGWKIEDVDRNALLGELQEVLGCEAVPSVDVLDKALQSLCSPQAGAKSKEPAASPAKSQGAQAASPTKTQEPATPVGPADGALSLDGSAVRGFQASQLLHESSRVVRERYGIPAPAPRQKRARLGAAGPSGGLSIGRDPPLSIAELGYAFREATGSEAKDEEVLQSLGTGVCVDEIEGTLQPLDLATLPTGPRERLRHLFQLQSHWRADRLEPLMAPTLKGQKIGPWLSKQTRLAFVELEPGAGEQRFLVKKFAGL